jgi:3-methyladenine DNA glycosylase AlkD
VNLATVTARLEHAANPVDARFLQGFFKTGPGEYGEGDLFRGIRVPVLRALARECAGLSFADTIRLLQSAHHEDRLLALLLLVRRFERGDPDEQRRVYDAYLRNTRRINNWDLVDLSAPNIVGTWSMQHGTARLAALARSTLLWERRIAIVATFARIRAGKPQTTLRLARRLLADPEDLIHKAAGWMLREVGKRDLAALVSFLDRHAAVMPRTMLRYAIERFPEPERKGYLAQGRSPRRGGCPRREPPSWP